MKARLLSPAITEITEAADWLDLQRIGLGADFQKLVDETLVQIEAAPLRFSRSEYASAEIDMRFAIVPRFNYVVHFAIESKEVAVVAVAHGAREPGYWLERVRR
jgi:toxin ParE1/3/4